MSTLDLILWIIAAICFLLAAFGVTARAISLGWLGAFFIALIFILK